MYFISKISVDEQERYKSSDLIDCTSESISSALTLLENNTKQFIIDEYGKQAADYTEIINILDFSQVSEPIIDTALIYRLVSDPHTLHVYQKRSKVIPGSWFGSSVVSGFHKTVIFRLHEFDAMERSKNAPVELITFGAAKIKVPKKMVEGPMSNVLDELKNSSRFKQFFDTCNNES